MNGMKNEAWVVPIASVAGFFFPAMDHGNAFYRARNSEYSRFFTAGTTMHQRYLTGDMQEHAPTSESIEKYCVENGIISKDELERKRKSTRLGNFTSYADDLNKLFENGRTDLLRFLELAKVACEQHNIKNRERFIRLYHGEKPLLYIISEAADLEAMLSPLYPNIVIKQLPFPFRLDSLKLADMVIIDREYNKELRDLHFEAKLNEKLAMMKNSPDLTRYSHIIDEVNWKEMNEQVYNNKRFFDNTDEFIVEFLRNIFVNRPFLPPQALTSVDFEQFEGKIEYDFEGKETKLIERFNDEYNPVKLLEIIGKKHPRLKDFAVINNNTDWDIDEWTRKCVDKMELKYNMNQQSVHNISANNLLVFKFASNFLENIIESIESIMNEKNYERLIGKFYKKIMPRKLNEIYIKGYKIHSIVDLLEADGSEVAKAVKADLEHLAEDIHKSNEQLLKYAKPDTVVTKEDIKMDRAIFEGVYHITRTKLSILNTYIKVSEDSKIAKPKSIHDLAKKAISREGLKFSH